MKLLVVSGLVTLFLIQDFGPAIAAETSQSEIDEEECIFDQLEQHKAYLELEKKYPGSRYIEDQYELQIPENGNLVKLRRGGCVHFGIYIEFQTARTDNYEEEDAFFAELSRLIADYGQKLLRPEMLETSRAKGGLEVVELDNGVYYVLPYPVAVFEVWRRHDEAHTTIGVSIYD